MKTILLGREGKLQVIEDEIKKKSIAWNRSENWFPLKKYQNVHLFYVKHALAYGYQQQIQALGRN